MSEFRFVACQCFNFWSTLRHSALGGALVPREHEAEELVEQARIDAAWLGLGLGLGLALTKVRVSPNHNPNWL